jgi:hypothetical protein
LIKNLPYNGSSFDGQEKSFLTPLFYVPLAVKNLGMLGQGTETGRFFLETLALSD